MLTPERRVKDQVRKILKGMGAYYAMPATGGYGSSGVPDFLVCFGGRFIGIECKANGGVPTALQEKNLREIGECGGTAFVIDENNVRLLETLMRSV